MKVVGKSVVLTLQRYKTESAEHLTYSITFKRWAMRVFQTLRKTQLFLILFGIQNLFLVPAEEGVFIRFLLPHHQNIQNVL